MRSTRLLAAVLSFAISALFAQDRPRTACSFEGFDANPQLAEVATSKPITGYYGCSSSKDCLPANLASGDLVVVYRVDGDWTCGYLSQRKGAGPGWVRSKNIRLVVADPAPSLEAWLGTWASGEGRIHVSAAKAAGKLQLDGEAIWRGRADSVHTGDFAGEASPQSNHLHFVEAGADSCTLDLTLIGPYIVASDNDRCGGANVRFWGVWKRAAK